MPALHPVLYWGCCCTTREQGETNVSTGFCTTFGELSRQKQPKNYLHHFGNRIGTIILLSPRNTSCFLTYPPTFGTVFCPPSSCPSYLLPSQILPSSDFCLSQPSSAFLQPQRLDSARAACNRDGANMLYGMSVTFPGQHKGLVQAQQNVRIAL